MEGHRLLRSCVYEEDVHVIKMGVYIVKRVFTFEFEFFIF